MKDSINAQAARELGIVILTIPLLVILPAMLLFGVIEVRIFMAVGAMWFLIAMVLIMGVDTISEISFGHASIRREVNAAKEAREEVEKIRDQLRKIASVTVENSYILSSFTPELTAAPKSPVSMRVSNNMNKIWSFAYEGQDQADQARQEVRQLLGHQ